MEPKIRLKGFGGEWKTYKIGNLTSITTGATPSTSISSYWDNGTIRWMSSGELNNRHIYDVKGRITEDGYNSCGTHLIPPGCVLIGLAGQGKTRGTAAINHVELCTNQSIAALLPNAQMFDSSYLYHYIDNKYLELRGMSTGDGGRGGLNKQILLDFEVKLPSMEEQIALASYFDSIDSLIQSTTKKIESLKQVKAASLQSMFPQEGETTPRVRFKGFERKWETHKVSDLLEERREPGKMSSDYPLMAFIANVGVAEKGDRYDRSSLVSDVENKVYKKTEYGDFIYSSNNLETGSIGLNLYGKATISPVYSIFKCTDIADAAFIGRAFVRREFINCMIKWRQGVMYGQWRIHEDDFLKIEVSVPSLNEQKKIGEYFTALDNQISYQTQRLEKLKQIKAACLDNMFV